MEPKAFGVAKARLAASMREGAGLSPLPSHAPVRPISDRTAERRRRSFENRLDRVPKSALKWHAGDSEAGLAI